MTELSDIAQLTVKYVNTTNKNIFLTGKAGTGKTTLLKHIIDHTYKRTAITAPTGIAAINAGGVTLHSLLQLPFGCFVPEDQAFSSFGQQVHSPHSVISSMKMHRKKRDLLRELELLIIDEVSMLRADLLDCADTILRHVRRRRNDPFGGVQLLFIGDLHQLPPVVKDSDWDTLRSYYSSAYFFDAQVMRDSPPIYVELDKIFRQSDEDFIGILNRLRDQELVNEDIETLNQYYDEFGGTTPEDGYIFLTTHNRKADRINQGALGKLESDVYEFKAVITGEFNENQYPTSVDLVLKKGAQVMFIKNDPSGEQAFFNGKIGVVTDISEDHVEVKCDDGAIQVERFKWENKRYGLDDETGEIAEKVIGTFEQYPLKLAWAITVHKSQGLTFDRAILDLENSFAPGQMYVALSRLTSLKGLVLASRIPEVKFEKDQALNRFADLKKDKQDLSNNLQKDEMDYMLHFTQRVFQFDTLLRDFSYHLQSFDKAENRSQKQRYLQWTRDFINDLYPLKEVGDKFLRQVSAIILAKESNVKQQLAERLAKANEYFGERLVVQIGKLKAHRSSLVKKNFKTYIKELQDLENLLQRKEQQITRIHLLFQAESEGRMPTKADVPIKTKKKEEKPKDKKPTKQVTFDLYQEGLSIADIARRRALTEQTIEGHLSFYVEQGKVDVFKLMAEEKLQLVLKQIEKMPDSNQLTPLKASLGDDFSFSEIKLAMAYAKSLEQRD